MNARRGRFALVGVAATVVDVGLAVGLVAAGRSRLVADLVALVAAVLLARLLHERVSLRGALLDRRITTSGVFVPVAVVAGAIDIFVFVGSGDLAVVPAKLLAVAAAGAARAVAYRSVLFKAVRSDQSEPAGRRLPQAPVRLTVVVPAFCEADRVAATVERLRVELEPVAGSGGLELIVVDDGSTDDTAAVAKRSGADVVLVQPVNQGKGAAVRAGVAAATGACIAFTDADLAYPPSQIMRFLEEIEAGWDVVIGDRHHPDTHTLRGSSKLRSVGSRAVNLASHVLLRGSYRDTQCGIKAFRRDVAHALFAQCVVDGFAFDIEVLHLVERHGLSLQELPVEVRNTDTSTVRAVRDGVGVAVDILAIRRRSRRGAYQPLAPDALAPVSGSSPG